MPPERFYPMETARPQVIHVPLHTRAPVPPAGTPTRTATGERRASGVDGGVVLLGRDHLDSGVS
jgi:hypothetical protein